MDFLDERTRRIILSLLGTIFFVYSCVILPLFKILPYGTLKKAAVLDISGFPVAQGEIESNFYYDVIELRYLASIPLVGSIQGQLERNYSSIGKNSDYWFLWHATEIWGPIAILLGITAGIILSIDSLSILFWEKPVLPFGWKLAFVIGLVGTSIQWLLFFLLWLSGEAETGTAVGTLGIKPVPGWPLLFLNILGLVGFLWAVFQQVKAAETYSNHV
ncbi:MAG: hypothetical protein ACE5OZ_11780 [Candidatus Heimdallarchaeota archaeon]